MPTLTKGAKFDEEKNRLDLISPVFLYLIGDILTFGAEKYEEHNWAKGILYMRVYRAAITHILDWANGEQNDQETGYPHLAHAACCLMFLLHYENDPGQYSEFNNMPNWDQMTR